MHNDEVGSFFSEKWFTRCQLIKHQAGAKPQADPISIDKHWKRTSNVFWRHGLLRNYVLNYRKVKFAMKLHKFWWKKWWCVESVYEHFLNNCVKKFWKSILFAILGEICSMFRTKIVIKRNSKKKQNWRVFKERNTRKASF